MRSKSQNKPEKSPKIITEKMLVQVQIKIQESTVLMRTAITIIVQLSL